MGKRTEDSCAEVLRAGMLVIAMSESFGRDRIEVCAGSFRVSDTWHAPRLALASHEHAHACVHFVLGGNYRESAAGRTTEHGPESVLFKPAGFRHANRFDAAGAHTLRMELDEERFAECAPRLREPRSARSPQLVLLGRRIERELAARDDLTPLALEGLVLELVSALWRCPAAPVGVHDRAQDCAELLRARFRRSWSTADLARELGCDRSGLVRAFRRRYGFTMGAYVRSLRVAEVMRLLSGGVSLAEAALRAGFADQSHCTRVFRRVTGTTPGAWASR